MYEDVAAVLILQQVFAKLDEAQNKGKLQVCQGAQICEAKCVTVEWWVGGVFSDSSRSWKETIFPVKHVTSIAPFFSHGFL